ncbi:MAG: hypothetical protein QXI58_00795 [Candidatus Micrarchaeia archaeon]
MIWRVESEDGQIFLEGRDLFPKEKKLKRVSWLGKSFSITIEAEKPLIFKRRFFCINNPKDIKTLYVIGFEKDGKKHLLFIDSENLKINFRIE